MKSLALLTPEERGQATSEVNKLASLSPRATAENNSFPSPMARLSQLCADVCLPQHADVRVSALTSAFFHPISRENKLWTSGVLVLLPCANDAQDNASIGFVADAMGAGGFRALTLEQHDKFVSTLHEAAHEISRWSFLGDVVSSNSGSVYPFLCEPPSLGSGSALQMPGALLLPAGVPAVVLAECWIHEALHTELHLAEWLEGIPPAQAEKELETPWRTVPRPASLLLHGAFVFSVLTRFIRNSSDEYTRVSECWELSATKGTRISLCDVATVLKFRKLQVEKAVMRLEQFASFSPIGLRVMEIIKENMRAA